MSIKNEDIDNAELSEELVDETQVDSLDEETLEEKAKVKKEEDDVEEDEDEVDVEEDAEDGVDGGDGQEVGDQETAGDAKGAKQSTDIPKTKAGILNAAYSMMKKAKKDEAVKLYQGMMKAAEMKEGVDVEDTLVSEDADVSHIDYEEDLNVLVAEEATLSDGFRGKASTIFEAAIVLKANTPKT